MTEIIEPIETNDILNSVAMIFNNPPQDDNEKPKRARGRPPKYADDPNHLTTYRKQYYSDNAKKWNDYQRQYIANKRKQKKIQKCMLFLSEQLKI